MSTLLPKDADNNIIPAVRLKDGGAQSVSVTAVSAHTAQAFDSGTRVVSLYATGPVYVRFGDETVTATTADHYFPTGVYYDFAIGGGQVAQFTHVAALRVSSDCTLYISEKE